MYILIEETEVIDLGHGDIYYNTENKVCSSSLEKLYEYCKSSYNLSEDDFSELVKYKFVENVVNNRAESKNLILNSVKEI